MQWRFEICEGLTAVDETENSVTVEVEFDFYYPLFKKLKPLYPALERIVTAYMQKDHSPDEFHWIKTTYPLSINFRWYDDDGEDIPSFWLIEPSQKVDAP